MRIIINIPAQVAYVLLDHCALEADTCAQLAAMHVKAETITIAIHREELERVHGELLVLAEEKPPKWYIKDALLFIAKYIHKPV